MTIKKLLAVCLSGMLMLGTAAVLPVWAEEETDTGTTLETYEDGMFTFAYVDGGVQLYACDTSALAVKIPAQTNGYDIVSIGSGAFYGCTDLMSVTIGENVKSIGDSAFMDCYALKKVTIPDNVESIGNYAFMSCKKLQLALPSGVTHIGKRAFVSCQSLKGFVVLSYQGYQIGFGKASGGQCKNHYPKGLRRP